MDIAFAPAAGQIIQIRQAHQAALTQAQAHQAAKQFAEAEKLWMDFLQISPEDPGVLYNVGVLHQARGELLKACTYYERAISSPAVDSRTKADAMNNIGMLMEKAGRPDKSFICYGLALQMFPDHPAARINYGTGLQFRGEFEEADREYARVLKLDPASAEAHFNQATVALTLGDFERGWREYEWRWKFSGFPTPVFQSARPRWQGEDLTGKTILLTTEQGFGDAIQFIRYAPLLKARGATVHYFGHTLLLDLLRGADSVDHCFDLSEEENFDYHLPLLSLPLMFGTTLENVPASVPYIRPRADWKPFYLPGMESGKVRKWASGSELPAPRESGNGSSPAHFPAHRLTRPARLGLTWAGSPRHGKDKWRSVAPEMFQPLIDQFLQCEWYSFQIGPKAGECGRLRGVHDLSQSILSWTDTAQALEQMDLLISVDTAVVHLAGALGKPVWMLTPHSPDWRWMLGRADSPWYPTLRLFRQPAPGDWASVFQRLTQDLESR